MKEGQTIFALATAAGKAGVSVFRISGPQARQAIESLCEPNDVPLPRVAALRRLKHPVTGEAIDRILVLYFPAPHSFTGEDVVEFHTHGGRAVAQAVTDCLQALPGYRLAEPGEFTRRAFENGKLDLTEAEAVADLVHAETEAQRRQALRQLDGALGKIYEDWRGRLSRALAYMEAAIDFSDEELPADMVERQNLELGKLRDEVRLHLDDAHRGERVRDGFQIAIIGPPNAGKSSLLNALARREAAIVSPTAGTTRDVIEVHLDIGGYAAIVADTAGLRDAADAIEGEGIRRARLRAEQADLKLLVVDGSGGNDLAALRSLLDINTLIVFNKSDIASPTLNHNGAILSPFEGRVREGSRPQVLSLITKQCAQSLSPLPNPPLKGEGILSDGCDLFQVPVFLISALTGQGIDALLEKLIGEIRHRFDNSATPPLTRARHRAALEECAGHIDRALAAPMADLRAEDVRMAVRALGRITGRVDVEDLLDIIFRDFCIGK